MFGEERSEIRATSPRVDFTSPGTFGVTRHCSFCRRGRFRTPYAGEMGAPQSVTSGARPGSYRRDAETRYLPRMLSLLSSAQRHAAVAALPPLVQQRPLRSMLFLAVALGHIAVEYGVQVVRRTVRDARTTD